MTTEEAFYSGFVKRAVEQGYTEKQAVDLSSVLRYLAGGAAKAHKAPSPLQAVQNIFRPSNNQLPNLRSLGRRIAPQQLMAPTRLPMLKRNVPMQRLAPFRGLLPLR